MSINKAKWTFAPFVLASSVTSFLHLIFVRFHANIFSIFFHSLSTAAFADGIFMAWGIRIICETVCNAVMHCLLFLQYGLHDESAILPYATLQSHNASSTRKFRFDFIVCSTPTILFALKNLARHSRSHWCFQFIASILHGLLKFLVLRVEEIDPSQFSCLFQMKFFHSTTFASPSAWRAFPFSPRVLAINNLAWVSAAFSWISPKTTYIRSVQSCFTASSWRERVSTSWERDVFLPPDAVLGALLTSSCPVLSWSGFGFGWFDWELLDCGTTCPSGRWATSAP